MPRLSGMNNPDDYTRPDYDPWAEPPVTESGEQVASAYRADADEDDE